MATPAELARLRTLLDDDQTEHLQRLLGSWSLLADLAFSDLLLVAPVATCHRPHNLNTSSLWAERMSAEAMFCFRFGAQCQAKII